VTGRGATPLKTPAHSLLSIACMNRRPEVFDMDPADRLATAAEDGATPNCTGRLNSARAPPVWLSTMPMRMMTSRLAECGDGSVRLPSAGQVSPRKSSMGGSDSSKRAGIRMEGSDHTSRWRMS